MLKFYVGFLFCMVMSLMSSAQLISNTSFNQVVTRDFARINGLDKENNFQTGINFELLDEFKLKGDFNLGTLKKDTATLWYTNNIGFELGLDEDLKKLVKKDEKAFTLTANYSGSILLLSGAKFSQRGEDLLQQVKDSCNRLVFAPNERKLMYMVDGAPRYFTLGKNDSLLPREITNQPCILFGEQNYDLFNTKKYYWITYKLNAGFSGITVFNAGDIKRRYAPNTSLDVTFNFYHWVSKSYDPSTIAGPQALGAKYITLGFEIAYKPLDDSKEKEYAKVADTLTAVNAIGKYNAAETKGAFDGATYSEMIKLMPHFDMYWFITKDRFLAAHAGIDGVFYRQVKHVTDWTTDLNFRIGLAFNVPSCWKNCTEDQTSSKISFEILLAGKEVFSADSFKEAIGPALKIGVPIANLK